MKPFRFTLEALQTLRQREEHLALETYARAVQTRAEATARMETVRRELEAGWATLRETTQRQTPAFHIRQLESYCAAVDERRKECLAVVEAAQIAVQKAWILLLQARQKREIVENYFTRQKAGYDLAAQREEQKLLDELASHGPKRHLELAEDVGNPTWN